MDDKDDIEIVQRILRNAARTMGFEHPEQASDCEEASRRLNTIREGIHALLAACNGALYAIHEEKVLQAQRGESVSVLLGVSENKLRATIALFERS